MAEHCKFKIKHEWEHKAHLCPALCCVWTAAPPGGSAERKPQVWTSPRAGSGRSLEDRTPFSEGRRRSEGPGASCLTEPLLFQICHDGGLMVEGCGEPGSPWRLWACHSACVCVSREERDWETLGTGVHLTEELRRSPLKTTRRVCWMFSKLKILFRPDFWCVCLWLTSEKSSRTSTQQHRIISECV